MPMDFNKRPTTAFINLENLRHNAKQLMSKMPEGQTMMGIIKANGYGHGSIMVARTLENCGVKKFGVATFHEAFELRQQGIRGEICILDGLMAPVSDYLSNRFYPVIYDMAQLKTLSEFLNKEGREFSAYLKFDTGMGRLGFSPSQVDEITALLRKTPQLSQLTIMTHLAQANEGDEEPTVRQYTLFRKLRDILEERGIKGAEYSICNSAALIDGRCEDFHHVRPGIALYGCYPDLRQKELIDLKPVMSLKTKIFSLKTMSPHSSIGYGATFTTERESRIAVVRMGYADGYPRVISNRGHALVRGQKAPIVGRISMDLMALDVTDVDGVELYDDVTFIGTEGDLSITAEQVAEWADTISYEILCSISERVPRIYQGT